MQKTVLLSFLFTVFLIFELFFFPPPVLAGCDSNPCTLSSECTVPDRCTCSTPPCSTTCQRDPTNPYGAKRCNVTEEPATTSCVSFCSWGSCNWDVTGNGYFQTRFCCNPVSNDEYQIRACSPGGEPGCPSYGCNNDGNCGQCESTTSCPSDCPTCSTTCGDGTCKCNEDSNNCAQDCGGNTSGCSVVIPLPTPIQLHPGETQSFTPGVTVSGSGTMGHVDFALSDATDFGVCSSTSASCALGSTPYSDTSSGFDAKITASNNVGAGSNLIVSGQLSDGTNCSWDTGPLEIVNNPSWCQAKEGDMIAAAGSISCAIPPTCSSPTCDPSLITSSTGGSPGIAVASGTISYGSGATTNLTVAGSAYAGTTFDYAYFAKKAGVVPFNPIPASINQSNLISGSTYGGIHWKKVTGNATISGVTDLGVNKVVLFVEAGNLTIDGPINLTDGQGFFMVVVDGNITVNPAVGGPQESPTPLPDLEGLYFANGTFDSGSAGPSSDVQLHVRGAVAAGGFSLQRDLSNNSETPGELFEYGPDQVLRLPPYLSRKQVVWRETAP